MHNTPDFSRFRPVKIEAHGKKDEAGAALPGLKTGHGGVDTKFPRFVIAGGHHATAAATSNGNGLPGEFGPFPHLHGCVKTIHVEVDDLAHA